MHNDSNLSIFNDRKDEIYLKYFNNTTGNQQSHSEYLQMSVYPPNVLLTIKT